MKIKQKLMDMAADKRGLQKRTAAFKRSLDEVNQMVNSIPKKEKNKKRGQ